MKRALLAVALVAACRDKQVGIQVKQSGSATASAAGSDAGPDALVLDETRLTETAIPATTRQLITGVTDSWSSTRAQLQLWTRTAAGGWVASGPAWDAVIGHAGTGWGIGRHGRDQRPAKREGDGKSPAGIFALRRSYGYAATPPAGTKLQYETAGVLECVDDPDSQRYTQIVDGTREKRDWKSSERMKRDDALYQWVIDIAHNPDRLPDAGSCIFFHVWGGRESSTTTGCTAMAQDKLEALMLAIDPAAEPLYVLLPREEYETQQATWGLPQL